MRVAVNGIDLEYEVHGAGRPMLVMHGGLGLDRSYLTSYLAPLAKEVELILYDHRGNGGSSRPDSLHDVTHQTWVEDADALREALGHEKLVLFGHSYGAFLALEYALAHPDRLDGLVLCSGAPAFDYPELAVGNARARATPDQLPALNEALTRTDLSDADYGRIWSALAPIYFHRYQPEHSEAFERVRYSGSANVRAMGGCLPNFNVVSKLGSVNVPTLLMTGRSDWITPPLQGAERMHAALPDSQVVVFEESGHFPFIEEPERFLDVMRAWLAGL